MRLNQGGKGSVLLHVLLQSGKKKKEVGRCVMGRNSSTISAPQIQTGYVSPLCIYFRIHFGFSGI